MSDDGELEIKGGWVAFVKENRKIRAICGGRGAMPR